MKRTLSSLLLLGVIGCGSGGAGDEPASTRQPVFEGTPTTAHPEVVSVLVLDGSSQMLCSGVLVAPHVVLTAASCLRAQPMTDLECPRWPQPEPAPQVYVGVGISLQMSMPLDDFIEVEEVTVAEVDVCHNNLALLALSHSIAGSYATPVQVREELVAAGEAVTGVGYGATKDNDSSATRTVAEGTVSCVEEGCDDVGEWAAFHSSDLLTCYGDGGGPVFDSAGAVIGVASYGSATCGVGESGYTHVPRFAEWIAETLVTLPPAPEVWGPSVTAAGGAGGSDASSTGGMAGSEGAPSTGGAAANTEEPIALTSDDEGCSCSAAGSHGPTPGHLALLAFAVGAVLGLRRRKHSRQA